MTRFFFFFKLKIYVATVGIDYKYSNHSKQTILFTLAYLFTRVYWEFMCAAVLEPVLYIQELACRWLSTVSRREGSLAE